MPSDIVKIIIGTLAVVGRKFTVEIMLHIYMNQSNKSIRISGIEPPTFSGMGIKPTDHSIINNSSE